MQLSVNDSHLETAERRIGSKQLDNIQSYLDDREKSYSKCYLLTNFINVIVIFVALLATASGGWWFFAFLILATVDVFLHMEMNDRAKHFAYAFALYYHKSNEEHLNKR